MGYTIHGVGTAEAKGVEGYLCHYCMATVAPHDTVVIAEWMDGTTVDPRLFHGRCWIDMTTDDDSED